MERADWVEKYGTDIRFSMKTALWVEKVTRMSD